MFVINPAISPLLLKKVLCIRPGYRTSETVEGWSALKLLSDKKLNGMVAWYFLLQSGGNTLFVAGGGSVHSTGLQKLCNSGILFCPTAPFSDR